MSSADGACESAATATGCFGTPEDWGLSKRKHAEMQAELADHLDCLQADEGIPAAEEVKASIEQPATRRKLAGVHLTDQVYATLNRLPTKQEWRELIFLLVCFAVILLSDWLAYLAPRQLQGESGFWHFDTPTTGYSLMVAVAWFLQAAGRAAFFAGLAWSLWRAWRLGTGVMLARVLQLKLIHTVLVVFVMSLIGRMLWQSTYIGMGFNAGSSWPAWFNATVILVALIVAGTAILLCSRGRQWALAFGLVLGGLFLFAGGPNLLEEQIYTVTLAWDEVIDDAGQVIRVPSNDKENIAERAEIVRHLDDVIVFIDSNEWQVSGYQVKYPSGITLEAWRTGWENFHGEYKSRVATGKVYIDTPCVAAGAGIGWLALPIPLLGLVGFVGLVVILGRRGPVEFATYTVLCILALATTLLPFVYDCAPEHIFVAGFQGMVMTPLPVIEEVLSRYSLDATWFMLVGGLVFSAGIPWLLTSLFLRPESAQDKDLA